MIKAALLSVFTIAAAYSSPVVRAEEEAAAKPGTSKNDVIVKTLKVAKELVPIIGGLFSRKECRQVACWIDTSKCYQQAADMVQNQVFQGRDGYVIESHGNQGAWVRYWRVRTDVAQSQTIATGQCGDGSSFSVFNCQSAGKVHC
ncbi:hypothetical protein FI667_g15018, partial [Globisporangium splendens]